MPQTDFDRVAAVYDESLPAHVIEHYLEKRVRYLRSQVAGGGRVLDVGCGTGVLAARLAASGLRVTGADPFDGMLDVARRERPDVEVVQAAGQSLPFEEGTFDLVYCVAVMHHVAEPDLVAATLGEMVRVCRPDGHVVVWDHNPRNPYWSNLMARVPQDTGEERLIPEREVLDGLTAAGARILRSDQLGLVPDFVPPRLLPLTQALERAVERTSAARRLCAHNVVLAAGRTAPDVSHDAAGRLP